MAKLNFISQRTKAMSLTAELVEGQKIKIETIFNMQVVFSDEDNTCIACLSCINEWKEHPELFHVGAEIEGRFECEGIETQDDKVKAHMEAHYQLFPLLQAQIVRMTAEAGLPPLIIGKVEMDPNSIVVTDEEEAE